MIYDLQTTEHRLVDDLWLVSNFRKFPESSWKRFKMDMKDT